MSTLYEVLGVRPDDDAETLTRAFRKAALASHPDLHGGDAGTTERFRQISDAYHVLRDAEQRACYDEELAVERDEMRRIARERVFWAACRAAAAVLVAAVAVCAWWAGIPQALVQAAAEFRLQHTAVSAADPRAGTAEAHPTGPQMPIFMTPPAASAPAPDSGRPQRTAGDSPSTASGRETAAETTTTETTTVEITTTQTTTAETTTAETAAAPGVAEDGGAARRNDGPPAAPAVQVVTVTDAPAPVAGDDHGPDMTGRAMAAADPGAGDPRSGGRDAPVVTAPEPPRDLLPREGRTPAAANPGHLMPEARPEARPEPKPPAMRPQPVARRHVPDHVPDRAPLEQAALTTASVPARTAEAPQVLGVGY